MARIGEYRLSIYHLLYNTPLFRYAEGKNTKKEYNVLILGNGWAGNEAFKAIFSVGQGINTSLNITVASSNALEYEERLCEVLPAFRRFADTKGYASVRFISTELDPDSVDCGLSLLDLDKIKYNYIIVALGDATYNLIAATELMTRISEARDSGTVEYSGGIIINVFDEFSGGGDSDDKASLIELGREFGIDISFFGKESRLSDGELIRIAKNINFAYSMKYNQRVSREDADREFMESLKAEFIDSPAERECGDLSIVNNFIGSSYTADSSIASALHIPYKLNACKEQLPSVDPKTTLADAISTKSKLYTELVALEHRRWNAYMVTRGYRAPTKDEEKKYLFCEVDGRINRHKDDTRLLHACLCDCGSGGSVLEGDFFNRYREWVEKDGKVKLSELDKASLRCHNLACIASERISENDLLSPLGTDTERYPLFVKSVKKLLNDEENSQSLYEKELEAAKRYAATVSEREYAIIREIDRQLTSVKARNGRMDFLSLDAQLIEMIPFCLWYRKENRTVITVSDGDTQHDVVIPTLLCAERAIFVHHGSVSEKYVPSVTEYFKKRGGNTVPEFIEHRDMSVDGITQLLSSLIDESKEQFPVINCVSHRQRAVSIAIGRIIERAGGNINAVSYDPDGQVVSLSGDACITVGINNKSFSVSEYLGLLGGRVITEYTSIYDMGKISLITDLFKKFFDVKKAKINGKTEEFVPWIEMNRFITSATKIDTSVNKTILESSVDTPFSYKGKFRPDVYNECAIDKFLKLLSDFSIIRNFSERIAFSDIVVTFDGMEPALCDILSEFEEKNTKSAEAINKAKRKTLRFSFNDGFAVASREISKKQLYKPDESPKLIEEKKAFIKDLYNKGFITEPEFGSDGTVSFSFTDDESLNILKKQGECFELVVYSAVRESALFDDVDKGTTFLWNNGDVDLYNRIKIKTRNARAFGYKSYLKIKENETYGTSTADSVKNELDIVAIKGMSPTFISCKTGKKAQREWLYEIDSIASHFHARGAMAISIDLTSQPTDYFIGKAEEMGISTIGTETLWNPSRISRAMKTIADGKTYKYK